CDLDAGRPCLTHSMDFARGVRVGNLPILWCRRTGFAARLTRITAGPSYGRAIEQQNATRWRRGIEGDEFCGRTPSAPLRPATARQGSLATPACARDSECH